MGGVSSESPHLVVDSMRSCILPLTTQTTARLGRPRFKTRSVTARNT